MNNNSANPTLSREVLLVGVYSDAPNSIRLCIDGVTQEGIKSVDLLSFMSASYRNNNSVVAPS